MPTESPTPHLVDLTARDRATDPALSCIVQAPAGSGKTTLLVTRFIRLLAEVDEPEQIVAITHTRKAANEMYQRICDALKGEGKPLASEQHETVQAVHQRAAQQGMEITSFCARLRVTTIDSLCQRLAHSGSYHQLNFAESVLHEQPVQLYRKAVRQVLGRLWQPQQKSKKSQQAQVAPDLLLVWQHYGCNTDALENALVDLLTRREQWLDLLSPLAFQDTSQLENSQECWKKLSQAQLAQLHAEVDEQFIRQWKAVATSVLAWSQSTNTELKNADAIHRIADVTGMPDRHWWHEFSSWICTQSGSVYTRAASLGFLANNKVSSALQTDLKNEKQQVTEMLAAVSENAQFTALLQMPLVEPRLPDEQIRLIGAIAHLAVEVTGQLMVLFAKEKSIDFIQIALNALQALEESSALVDADVEIAHNPTGIQHLLVDEFQDTSPVQWRLIELITRHWQKPNSLFLVGDPMQSIYGFRQAQVALFMRAQKHGVGAIQLENLTLSSNFRSQPMLVEWVNQIGGKMFGSSVEQVPFVPAKAAANVRSDDIQVMRSCDPVRRDSLLIELLQQQPSDTRVALLVQRKSLALELMELLDAQGMGYTAVDLVPLGEQQHLIDVSNLTHLLLEPLNWRYWLGVLRCPQVAAPLELCTQLYTDIQTNKCTPLQAIAACVEQQPQTAEGRIDWLYQRIWPILSLCGYRPLIQLVRSLHASLGFGQLMSKEAQGECALLFAKLEESAKSQLGSWWIDWQLIDDWLNNNPATRKKAATERQHCSIEIMTCHKAKGLEFDLVVLPYADSLFRDPAGMKPPLKYDVALIDGKPQLLMAASVDRFTDTQHPNYKYLEWLEKNRKNNEHRRLLYVALTRAKQDLVLLGGMEKDNGKDKPQASFFGWLKEAGCEIEKHPTTSEEQSSEPVQRPFAVRRQLTNFADFVHDLPDIQQPLQTGGERLRLQDRAAMQLGTCLHSVMEQLHKLVADNTKETAVTAADVARIMQSKREHWHRELCWEKIESDVLPEVRKEFDCALDVMAADSRVVWMLQPHQHKHSEWSLIKAEKTTHTVKYSTRIIDLTFVENGVRWIIDYKTTKRKKGESDKELDDRVRQTYEEQLNAYAELVSELPEQYPIRLCIYLLVEQFWVEWQYEE